MSKIYNEYAHVYDFIFEGKDYRGEARYVARRIVEYASGLPRILCDMGCGTGRHMLHLANDGYAVYGVDASREMINIASKRLSEYGNITLVEGRDDEVVLPAKVTGILCMFSTFNEKLTDTDVRTALLNYKRNLLAGGVIIIDMIDEAYFRSSFKKWCEEETRTARVRSSVIIQYDESRIARIRKEYKVYNDDGRSEVFEDEFALRLYQDSQLMQIVEEVGFEVMRIDKGFVDENRKERLVLVGRG